jgi:release factor glutamine methyltransferase
MTSLDHAPPDRAAVELTLRLRAAGCVFAEDEAALLLAESASAAHLETMVRQRENGVPLEQIVGWVEFCGLRVQLAPGVFVPRRRTSLLVREAAALAAEGAVVLDLCCGSGAIGLALAHVLGGAELHATDLDPAAVACARLNLASVGGTVYAGDLDETVPSRLQGQVDLVVACPPYVPTDAIALMPPEARDHEPVQALDGGHDGLALVRRIAAVAGRWLASGGHLLVESSDAQSATVVSVLGEHGLGARTVTDEEMGATVVVGRASPLGG